MRGGERLVAPLAISATAVAAWLTLLLELSSPLRVGLVLLFLLTCPGWALAQWVPLGQGVPRAAGIVGISLVIDMLVAEALLYSGHWSPRLGFGLLVAACLGAAISRAPVSAIAVRRGVAALAADPMVRRAGQRGSPPPLEPRTYSRRLPVARGGSYGGSFVALSVVSAAAIALSIVALVLAWSVLTGLVVPGSSATVTDVSAPQSTDVPPLPLLLTVTLRVGRLTSEPVLR